MDLLEFKDQKPVPDIVHEYIQQLKDDAIPIVIDNGSYQCRVGWANNTKPLLLFKNLIAKPRKERSKKETVETQTTPQLHVGNDIQNVEAVRFQLKTQFDRNVVTHFEAQEHVLDYVFSHLGINNEESVPHPIVITEAFLNPNSSRQLMSELLFECYNVPGISYGVDSLLSYHFTQQKPKTDALLVSFGYHTIHVIPIINNTTIFSNTRRLNLGGFHVISFLHRVLQLKYPAHSAAITLSRAEELLHSICLVALDYREELNRWTDPDYYEKHTKRIQLPFSAAPSTSLSVEQQKERKRELARRLTEINARKREERLAEDEEKLNQLLQIQEMLEVDSDMEDIEKVMTENQIKNVDDLQKNIAILNMKIEKRKQKMLALQNSEELTTEEPIAKQPKLKVLNKISIGNEKLLLQNARKMKQDILNKKAARRQKKQDMAKRRTAAGQERMRIISQLARKEKGNDDFGLRDEDWEIYKTISRDGGDSDSEAENEKLMELDEIIRSQDPSELDEGNTPGELHQLHIGIERYRAPELIFKPYMQGSSEAGLSEVIGYVLSLFDPEDQAKLAANVVLTGGLANLPGLKERIHSNLISIRPFQSFSNVNILESPSISAWNGCRQFVKSPAYNSSLFTKSDYDEFGQEYFKMHVASNIYVPTPKGQIEDIDV